eukprot:CAMPEP_0115091850 /NCGR_PEP_ID=MMETSP0227-20121206/26372_1 /TAXON_ID=89957 /ORGANISM="Polarella glacialis, Strain CCMP 1383" /LENGTH=73 /DNA_ID=CAMNT_0002483469 /DNA_START=57 /DNA_END=278 /DNA_ORIENTATION=+
MAKTTQRRTDRALVKKEGAKALTPPGPSHAVGKADRAARKKQDKLDLLKAKLDAAAEKKNKSDSAGMDADADL